MCKYNFKNLLLRYEFWIAPLSQIKCIPFHIEIPEFHFLTNQNKNVFSLLLPFNITININVPIVGDSLIKPKTLNNVGGRHMTSFPEIWAYLSLKPSKFIIKCDF